MPASALRTPTAGFLMLFLVLTAAATPHPESALPFARGFGAHTVAGRGGEILVVNDLTDPGANESAVPGQLRHALEQAGPRIVIFEVSGEIELNSRLDITEPYLTVAGQTSPGGVTLKNYGIRITTNDVLIQHLRIRPGDDDVARQVPNDIVDGVCFADGAERVVVDHCSISWATDENIAFYDDPEVTGGIRDITVSNCIVSEALSHSWHRKGQHSMGALVGRNIERVSMFRNIFAHNRGRNPEVVHPVRVGFENNLVYDSYWNTQLKGMPGGDESAAIPSLSVVGNVFRLRPGEFEGDNNRRVISYKSTSAAPIHPSTVVYMDDNRCADCDPEHDTLEELWQAQVSPQSESDPAPNPTTGYLVAQRPGELEIPNFTPMPSCLVEASLKAEEATGAGAFPRNRDDVDREIIAQLGVSLVEESQDCESAEGVNVWHVAPGGEQINCVDNEDYFRGAGSLLPADPLSLHKVRFAGPPDPALATGYLIKVTSGGAEGQIHEIWKEDPDNEPNTFLLKPPATWDPNDYPNALSEYRIKLNCAANGGGWRSFSAPPRTLSHPVDPHAPIEGAQSFSRVESWTQSFSVADGDGAGIYDELAQTNVGNGASECYEYQYRADVRWNSSRWATSQVRFRPVGGSTYGETPLDDELKTKHEIVAALPFAGTEYALEAISTLFGDVEYSNELVVSTYPAVRSIDNESVVIVGALSGVNPVIQVEFETDAQSSAKVHVRKEGESSWGNPAATWSRLAGPNFSVTIHTDDGVPLVHNTRYEVGIQVFEDSAFAGEDTMHPDGFTLGCDITNTHIVTTPELNFGSKTSSNTIASLSLSVSANPAGSEVGFALGSPIAAAAELAIYNLAGQLVRRIPVELDPGVTRNVIWDSRDGAGAEVGRGVYFARLRAGEHVISKAVTLLR